MPRIIVKCNYIKPVAAKYATNMLKYIATRDGVDKMDDTARLAPATVKQMQMIENILKDFPDTAELFEYEDYVREKTRGTASEFVERALEDKADRLTTRKTYADYIATRPRAEKFGTHGLFTDDGVQVNLNQVSKELRQHNGNVWTMIISLTFHYGYTKAFYGNSNWIISDFKKSYRLIISFMLLCVTRR